MNTDLRRLPINALLCDADGNLFPSEEPAFAASAGVANRFLASLGADRRYTPDELRREGTGMTFRTTARRLAAQHGHPDADVEPWVAEERSAVTEHLARTLHADPPTTAALAALAGEFVLATVSSSALARLAACFTATGLDRLFPPERRFSAEDSLPAPTSKPDPAIYRHACAELGLAPADTLVVEDSVPGVLSAVAAGCPTVGNLRFVPVPERTARARELRAAGAFDVVSSWTELAELLEPVLVERMARAS